MRQDGRGNIGVNPSQHTGNHAVGRTRSGPPLWPRSPKMPSGIAGWGDHCFTPARGKCSVCCFCSQRPQPRPTAFGGEFRYSNKKGIYTVNLHVDLKGFLAPKNILDLHEKRRRMMFMGSTIPPRLGDRGMELR